jgi:hypothetical protein
MSGLEIFGAIGTAVSVLEGISAAKSYLSDVRHLQKQKDHIKDEVQRIGSLVKSLEQVISSMPQDSSKDLLACACTDFESSVNNVLNTLQGSSNSFKWTIDKAKIKAMQEKLDRLGALLTTAFTGYNM